MSVSTSTWNVATSADWNSPSDWSPGLPTGSDVALIAPGSGYTVTIANSESFSVAGATIASGTLALDGTLTANTLSLTGGGLSLGANQTLAGSTTRPRVR